MLNNSIFTTPTTVATVVGWFNLEYIAMPSDGNMPQIATPVSPHDVSRKRNVTVPSLSPRKSQVHMPQAMYSCRCFLRRIVRCL